MLILTFGPTRWFLSTPNGRIVASFFTWTEAKAWCDEQKVRVVDMGKLTFDKPWYWQVALWFASWRKL